MSLNISMPTKGGKELGLAELEPGNLYSVTKPNCCKGDLVLAVRENSSSRASTKIVVLTCRLPFGSRTPFVGSPPISERWAFEPAPEGTAVTITTD